MIDNMKLNFIKNKAFTGKYAVRIMSEIDYCANLSKYNHDMYDGIINQAIAEIFAYAQENDCISQAVVLKAESILSPLSTRAKSKTVLCVAHAHIDMNWLWGYEETVNITLSTFRTMLILLKEYPQFTFSQSQASVYEIVEKYDPEMLEEIRKYVQEGRWEITASTWVETDKNMVNGEGLTRHILYTRNYLKKLFHLSDDYFCMDFEPDTFGHNLNVPEICRDGGIKYYYHCRGQMQTPTIVKWRAPSGKSLLVYKEPFWYNASINPQEVADYLDIMQAYQMDKILKVYGVGDHGGGATRRDLVQLLEMDSWPLMPHFEFSTYRSFFDYIENNAKDIPEFDGELNYIFSGCYTSQSRIKKANRRGEKLLKETEKICSYTDGLNITKSSKTDMQKAWQLHLFNHFHDILPGSGVRETREYALGKAQERDTILSALKTKSLIKLAENIKLENLDWTRGLCLTAEGAGVGFTKGVFSGNIAGGSARAYLVFNYGNIVKEQVVELTLWDYDYNLNQLSVCADGGSDLPFEIVDQTPIAYWGHTYRRIYCQCVVPANGYCTIIVSGDNPVFFRTACENSWSKQSFGREHSENAEWVLENEVLIGRFSATNGALTWLENKSTGQVYSASGKPLANFINSQEETSKGMTSWIVGKYILREDLIHHVTLNPMDYKPNGLVKRLKYKIVYGNNTVIYVEVSLKNQESYFDYHVTVEYREFGNGVEGIPSLQFGLKMPSDSEILYDVPYGIISRAPLDDDQVANNFICAKKDDHCLILSTDSKYGFRAFEDTLEVNLIRASGDPDKFPENYEHDFHIYVGADQASSNKQLIEKATSFQDSLDVVSFVPKTGQLRSTNEMFHYEGCSILSAVKTAENDDGLVFRFYDCEGKDNTNTLSFDKNICKAYLCDSNENNLSQIDTHEINKLNFIVEKFGVTTLKIFFKA